MRNICVVTGTRSEYGLLRPVMKEIKKSKKLKLSLIVTGMHLSKEFGYSYNLILKDGFKITKKVKMDSKKDSPYHMAQSIGKGIQGISNSLKSIKPDIVLILGDRTEALAATVASAYMNIPVAHIHGGDKTKGGLDESARHAITKFAHIHFAATEKSEKRIKKLGEDPKNIFNVGAPGLDEILNQDLIKKEILCRKLGIDPKKPFIVLIQHSVSTEPKDSIVQISKTISAIKSLSIPTVAIYPNSDAGGRGIIRVLKKHADNPLIRLFKTLRRIDYLSLLKYASVLVGNSSSGMIESSSFNLPVVNIGIRQEGRERSGNVIDVPHDTLKIKKAIEKALSKEFRKKAKLSKNPYGDGKSSKRIVKILENIRLDKGILKKSITY